MNLNLIKRPSWFTSKNPLGKVPTVEIDGECLYESLVICEWLDDMYPGPRVLFGSPTEKANQKMLVERLDKVHYFLK